MVVVTTPPEMVAVAGATRINLPVGEVTTIRRIEPSVEVTTSLTVPNVTPLLVLTVRPVVNPGSAVAATEPRASALLVLARAMPVVEAFSSPWLPLAFAVVVVVVAASVLTALLGLALSIARELALTEPWLLLRASIAVELGPPAGMPTWGVETVEPTLALAAAPTPAPCPGAASDGLAKAIAATATVAQSKVRNIKFPLQKRRNCG